MTVNALQTKCLSHSLKKVTFLDCLLKKGTGIILLLLLIFHADGLKAQSRIYLSNDDHTDYMFYADEKGYDTLFVNMIDAWMANNNATSTKPADYQTKFICDGTYWA